jgi:heterodisulfide reductase subunit A-like polyferredoxin
MDCNEVTIVCLETREQMPAWQFEIEEALEAGVEIVNCFGPNRFVAKDGRFFGIEFKRCTCVFDDHCNFNPQYDETDLNTLAAQTVIIAIGQKAVLDVTEPQQIATSLQGEIIADPVTLQTNIPWVFAGGDAVYGPRSVVEAIASGKQAAQSIHRYLSGRYLKADRSRNGPDIRPETATVDNHRAGKTFKQKPWDNYQVPISQRSLSDADLLPKPRVPMPVLPLAELQNRFSEVELGYSEAQAVSEARRCLVCGPCSECMACVESCKPLAVIQKQQAMAVELDVNAIIFADDPLRFEQLPLTTDEGIYRVLPEDLLLGSATAARIMSKWRVGSNGQPFAPISRSTAGSTRMGVFICRCGDTIAQTVDVEALRRHTATLTDVIFVQVLPFSCSPEAGKNFAEMVSSFDLTHVVLAACACCSLDQVCYSCTYQRVRCKQNLGLFDPPGLTQQPPAFAAAQNSWPLLTEFVNIREQCAWVHCNDPPAATNKAKALITGAAAKLRMTSSKSIESQAIERSVLIAGSGEAAFACRDHLQNRDIDVRQLSAQVARIWRTNGRYAIEQNGYTWTAESIVLAPQEPSEANDLISAFGTDSHQPRIQSTWGGLESHLPGVFYCGPQADGLLVGAAAAARVSAWLGRCSGRVKPNNAVVDVYRCRACQTCMDICEFGAPQLVGQEPNHNAWVDPNICTGCGTCAANCPSGAITAGYSSDEQLTAMVEAILTDGDKLDENR